MKYFQEIVAIILIIATASCTIAYGATGSMHWANAAVGLGIFIVVLGMGKLMLEDV